MPSNTSGRFFEQEETAAMEKENLKSQISDFKSRCSVSSCSWSRLLVMPTVLRIGPYRFYFWSHELNEPPHIQVDREARSAKFWLAPVSLARNLGFRAHELRDIQELVEQHETEFQEAWDGHFGAGGG
jgi:hypothetical protein